MSVNRVIINALKPEGLPIEPNLYTGTADKFYTFNYVDDRGLVFADDEPQIDVVSVQIHLFVPQDYNYISLRKNTRARLLKAGFSYPSITELNENDTKKKHIIFECEIDKESESEVI